MKGEDPRSCARSSLLLEQRNTSRSRGPHITASVVLLGLLVVSAGTWVVLLGHVRHTARGAMDRMSLRLLSAHVDNVDGPRFCGSVEVTVTNPNSETAEFRFLEVAVQHPGNRTPLCWLHVPGAYVVERHSETNFTFFSDLHVINRQGFEAACSELWETQGSFMMRVTGRVVTSTSTVIGTIHAGPQVFSNLLSVSGLGGLDFSPQSFHMLNDSTSIVTMHAALTFLNPSGFTGVFPPMELAVHYEDEVLGVMTTEEVHLVHGVTPVQADGYLVGDSPKTIDVIAAYLGGTGFTVQVGGNCLPESPGVDTTCTNVLAAALARRPVSIKMESEAMLTMKMLHFMVVEGCADWVGVDAHVVVNNPSSIGGTFSNVSMSIVRNNTRLGLVPLGRTSIISGDNYLEGEGRMPTGEVVEDVLTRYLNGKLVHLEIHFLQPHFLSNVRVPFTMLGIQDPILQKVNLVLNFNTIVSVLTDAKATVHATVFNPLPFPFVLSRLSLDLYYNHTTTGTPTMLDHVVLATPLDLPADGSKSTFIDMHLGTWDAVFQFLDPFKECGGLCLLVDAFHGSLEIDVNGFFATLRFGCEMQQNFCRLQGHYEL